jgi:hypothetical protein
LRSIGVKQDRRRTTDPAPIVEIVRRRALLVPAAALIGAACSLSGLDGLSGGADTPEGGSEAGANDSPSEPDVLPDVPDAPSDALNSGCQGDPPCQRVLFVTQATFATSDFGSLEGADALCEKVANGPNAVARVRNRPMRAWLSIAAKSAAARLVHGTSPYVRSDGNPIAADFDHLVTTYPVGNVDVDETGHDLPPAAVWTGTFRDGTSDDMLCNDWTSTSASVNGLTGWTTPESIDAGPEVWTFNVDKSCNTKQHLYCVER